MTMKLRSRIAAAAALSLISAVPFLATPATAAVDLPKFLVSVERSRVNDDVIEKIHQGQTKDEVVALIGAPQHTAAFPRSHTIAWDYDYRDIWGYESVFSVILDESGVVQGKTTARWDS
jgi:outer membrane protein assembly factor BamE (lipoprotein component of BamABCDE complex)